MFPDCSVTHGTVASFDYLPIWLNKKKVQQLRHGGRSFRFESMWIGEKESMSIIEDTWRGLGFFMPLLKQCGHRLLQWNKATFGNIQANLGKAKNTLSKLQEEGLTCAQFEQHIQIRNEVNKWLEKNELM